MRKLLPLLLTLLLAGCVISSPQKAQYNAEYSNRQDIRTQSVYRFITKPVKPSGENYWGAGDLPQLFYVTSDNAAVVELRFNYPAKSLLITSLDGQNNVLEKKTFALLDESASKPSDPKFSYFYLTKDGELMMKYHNCTPDMSVGCRWFEHRIFITRNTDLAVQYESGSAGMAFLLIPFYGSQKYFEVFPRATMN